MTCRARSLWPAHLALLLAFVLLLAGPAQAERRPSHRSVENEPAVEVEMFQAIDDDQIDVKFIPRSDKEARVIIRNKSGKPLRIRLPEAFAGVPVLNQVGVGPPGGGLGGAGGGRGGLGGDQQNQSQGLGGGMGGMGMGGMGMGGMGMGMMNIRPEQVSKLKVTTVCLEHGKKEPHARIPYEIRPIDEFNDQPEVRQLLTMLGHGQIDQRAAQAAAWHLANDMSWQELATKQVKHLNGLARLYFHPLEIQRAVQAAAVARAEARKDGPDRRDEVSDSLSPAVASGY